MDGQGVNKENHSLVLPIGTVGCFYEFTLDIAGKKATSNAYTEVVGLDATGLTYLKDTNTISGVPSHSGVFLFHVIFRDAIAFEVDSRTVIGQLVVEPDPKSLWKNVPSDPNILFAKPDDAVLFQTLGPWKAVGVSKRGRSHADVGGPREDDLGFAAVGSHGWQVAVIADGAGSAKFARKASAIAVAQIISFFSCYFVADQEDSFGELIAQAHAQQLLFGASEHRLAICKLLDYAVRSTYVAIQECAETTSDAMRDYNTTLAFVLFRKFSFGIVLLSFGVGDSPAVALRISGAAALPLTRLDIDVQRGGTMFLPMREVFESDQYSTRFRVAVVEHMEYLMLMTDGIFDTKFGVELNLISTEKWRQLFSDFDGNNEEKVKVNFNAPLHQVASDLSNWMDFWSAGNHDDRSLIIVY
jgi:serine/threonine protein phosphatase PrpC